MQRKIRWSVWFSILLVAAFIAGYLVSAKANAAWPYDDEIVGLPRHQVKK